MMKRNKIISIVVLSVTILACGFVGWLLIKAIMDRNEAERQRNNDFTALKKIYAAKVFPSPENIERTVQDQKDLENWLKETAVLLHKGDIPESSLSPATFKQKLQASVRQLSNQPGIRKGKVVMPDFHFGFEQYLGESDALPKSEHVQRLTKQLSMIELISGELFAAKILALDTVGREVFETETPEVEEDTGSTSRRRRDRNKPSDSAQNAAPAAVARLQIPDGLVGKERFTFEFTATAEAFVDVLNKLAATDLFVVVAESTFQKTDDQLKAMETKPGVGMEESGLKKDHAKLSYAERTVTHPRTDPPVKVKLVIDVYTFEGV